MSNWKEWVKFTSVANTAVIVTAIGLGFRPDALQGFMGFVAIIFGPLAILLEDTIRDYVVRNDELLMLPDKWSK